MKKNVLKRFLFLVLMLSGSVLLAQTVTGTVTESSGPLPGVNVLVKGTQNGTTTDFNGKYTLNNISNGAVIIFSYLGYKTQEVTYSGTSPINIVLKAESEALNEVVVIGYGSIRKKDATGAIDAIGPKDFDAISATSPAELLRGKVSGVQVTSSSGAPGAAINIRVRGNTSIRSGNNPLIVVDGVPLDGSNVSAGGNNPFGSSPARSPLNFINQNDIASINVLKDASSTAIYGSRGANGVILITTKRGKRGEPSLTYNSSVGISTLSRSINLMSSQQFVDFAQNSGGRIAVNDLGSRGYDWKNVILRTGVTTTNDVAFSSSTDKSRTRLSLGINSQQGIVKQTGLDKYTANFSNINNYFDDKLIFDTNILFTHIKDESEAFASNAGFTGDLLSAAMRWNPTRPLRDSSGNYTYVDDQSNLNPLELLNSYQDKTNTSRIVANIKTTFKISNNLTYKFSLGLDRSTSIRASQLLPTFRFQGLAVTDPNTGVDKQGRADITNVNSFARVFEHTLNFTKSFSDDFNFNALLGYSYSKYDFDGSHSSGQGYDKTQTNLIDNIGGGLQSQFKADSYRSSYEIQSYFGRVNGNYKKILFTATVRADGSSKFGKNNKYGYFPSVGLGYKIFENQEGKINNLKIRSSWGITGNQEFPINQAIAVGRFSNNGTFNTINNANPDLKWEKTTSYDVGTDFSFFKNKLSGSVDYFYKKTEDLIFATSLESTQPSAGSRRFINLPGNLVNDGFEFNLNYDVVDHDDFKWSVSGNASFIKNKSHFDVFEFTGGINGQGLSGASAEVIANNKPLYTYFLLNFQGFDAQGNNLFTDPNGGTDAALAVPGFTGKQPLPKVNVGFTTSINYKSWDFSTSLYGAFGNYIYNNTANALFFAGAYNGGNNVTVKVGSSNEAPGNPNAASTRFLERGDFLRLSNLTIGYTFKNAFLTKMKLKSARLYANGDNLFVITGYSGFDPEVDTSHSLNGVPSAGIDYLSYPRATTVSLGLSVSF